MKAIVKTKHLLEGMNAIKSIVPKNEAIRILKGDGEICVCGLEPSHIIAVRVAMTAEIDSTANAVDSIIPYGQVMRSLPLLKDSDVAILYTDAVGFMDIDNEEVASFVCDTTFPWGYEEDKMGKKVIPDIEKLLESVAIVPTNFLKNAIRSARGTFDHIRFTIDGSKLVISGNNKTNRFSTRCPVTLSTKPTISVSAYSVEYLTMMFANIKTDTVILTMGNEKPLLVTVPSEVYIRYALAPILESE